MNWKLSNVPIPIAYVLGLVLGGILQFIFPRTIFQLDRILFALGLPLIGLGIGLAAWAVHEAGATDVEAPDTLITGGPYTYSRNPMYVGWILIYLGVVVVVNSLWMFVLFSLVFVTTHFVDIPKEERYLTEQFGEEYLDYQSRVRRYL